MIQYALPAGAFLGILFFFWGIASLLSSSGSTVEERMARFPFVVAFAFTRDETNHFADVLLPDAGDLESLQLIRIGG